MQQRVCDKRNALLDTPFYMPYPQAMRIGFDARMSFYSSAGLGRYINGLLGGLASIDHENQYLVFHSRKDRSIPQRPPNYRTRLLWTPCHHPLEQATLPVELSFARLDLLHSPDFIPPLHRRIASVITVHDLAFLYYPQYLVPEARRYYGQIGAAVKSAEAIIAVSQHTKKDLIEQLGVPEGKVHVVYEAANPLYRPLGEVAFGSPQRVVAIPQPYILFVGTLEPRKNLPALLRAMAQIKGQRASRTPRLVMAGGKGWLYQESLDLVGQLGLTEETLLFGPAAPEELLWLYNRAELLVLPSVYEGFGLPVVEAMACGTPVVVSRTSSLPEVAGDAGLLVDPADSEALAEAICRVLDDQALREKMRQAGLQQAGRFSWESTARETLDVYHKAAGN